MSAILKLVQGTAEWHAHRATTRNASETPAVLGVSPFQTPYQLWLIRTGRLEQKVTPAMRRGSELESTARAAYEALTGRVLEPLVLQDGEYSASLDGITFGREVILEIKCPYKGRGSDLWQAVSVGELPEHYWWQVQHQLMVARAARAELFVFDGEAGLVHQVAPKPESWRRIHEAWEQFMNYLATDSPPPLMERDTLLREDPEWKAAAEAYVQAKAAADEADAMLDQAKRKITALATHTSEQGAGVTVSRYWKQGAIDYKKVPHMEHIDLEQYRLPKKTGASNHLRKELSYRLAPRAQGILPDKIHGQGLIDGIIFSIVPLLG